MRNRAAFIRMNTNRNDKSVIEVESGPHMEAK